MKILILLFTLLILLFNSCAIIVGGSKYTALVNVEGSSSAVIKYNGMMIGEGTGRVKIPRNKADQVHFTITKEGCESKTYDFRSKRIRGWTMLGSFLLSPTLSSDPESFGVPIPVWNILDLASGAIYKPDINEKYVVKGDYNNYYYNLPYDCDTDTYNPNNPAPNTPNTPAQKTKEQKLIELKELYDTGMITKEEYDKSRQAILNQ